MALRWLRRLDYFVCAKIVHFFDGLTLEEVAGVEQGFVTKMDEKRQEKEALEARLGQIESQLIDIRDRRLIAHSVPDADWTAAALKHTLDDLTGRLEKLTADAERRRTRSSALARIRPRDASGRFLSDGNGDH